MKKLYDLYSNNVYKVTKNDRYYLSIYTVEEYINEYEEEKEYRIEELNNAVFDWSLDDYVLAPFNVDISVYRDFEEAFINFFDNDFSMLKKVIDNEGIERVKEACKHEPKSLQLIERIF